MEKEFDSFWDCVGYALNEEEVKKWESLKTDEEREEFNKAIEQKREKIINDWIRDLDKQVIDELKKELKKK